MIQLPATRGHLYAGPCVHILLLQSQQEEWRKANKYLGASGAASPASAGDNLGHVAPVGTHPRDVPAGRDLQVSEAALQGNNPTGQQERTVPGAGEAVGTVGSHPAQLLWKWGLLSCFSCIHIK